MTGSVITLTHIFALQTSNMISNDTYAKHIDVINDYNIIEVVQPRASNGARMPLFSIELTY